MKTTRITATLTAILVFGAFTDLRATNGMNLEGYGPVATSMGGASFAYDNGTAAVINNPATLGFMPEETRLDAAFGFLGPDVTAISPQGEPAESQSKLFVMPAAGFIKKTRDHAYGLAMFGQGGMGCEYLKNSWRGLGFDLENRTEVSVGRIIAPLVYDVSDKLSIGGTVDFVWASMDLRMAMSGTQFFDLIDPMQQEFGTASGTLVETMGQIFQMLPAGTSVDYAYFDFSNKNPLIGEARGYGVAAKIGMVYKANDNLTFGLTYHTRTSLEDLKAEHESISFQLDIPGMGKMPQLLRGDITVNDFEWPAMLGAGVAVRPNLRTMVVFDVRYVFWEEVMKDFKMSFQASDAAENGNFAGQSLNATLYQNWENQTVIAMGVQYAVRDNLMVRAGFNHAKDPIPDKYLNCLFPAIVENHLSFGLGYKFNDRSSIDFSYVHGFEERRTSGYGVTAVHSQDNFQIMYTYRFGKKDY